MATSYRPDEHGSRDDRPKTTDSTTTPESGTTAETDRATDDATETAVHSTDTQDAETVRYAEPDTRIDRSGTPAGSRIEESTAPETDTAADLRRRIAEQLGVARTRNRGTTDFGLLILRLLNVVLFLHGLVKATGFGVFRETVAATSLGALAPTLFAVLVVVGQLALPIAIAFGLLTRLAGLLQAVMMGLIWVLVPLAGGLLADNGGIAGESAYLFTAIGLTLAFTGAGRISIDQVLFAGGAERRAIRRTEKKLV